MSECSEILPRSLKNSFVTGPLLNRCPLPIRPDMKMAVLLLRTRSAAAELMARSGLPDSKLDISAPGLGFREDFRVTCDEIDALMALLREKNQLSERLEDQIDVLRMQFRALTHYFFRMSSVKNRGVDSCIAMLEEMRNCYMYTVRIYPNITLMRMALSAAVNFKQAQKVYNYMMGDKYVADVEEELVTRPDEKFFKIWLARCKNPLHFEVLYDAMTVNSCLETRRFLAIPWLQGCHEIEEFEGFADRVISDGVLQPNFPFFLSWLGRVRSPNHLCKVIESLFKAGISPCEREIGKILGAARALHDQGLDFMTEVMAIYVKEEYREIASSFGMIDLYGRLNKLKST
ncbi:hypothetical protein HZA40_03550 [Candidatus Peregrinibacteria bacterium]|nr:hypothetical protein [Candidatus Peregrinibacteria bacterium]